MKFKYISALLLLATTTAVEAQFFDIFSNLHSMVHNQDGSRFFGTTTKRTKTTHRRKNNTTTAQGVVSKSVQNNPSFNFDIFSYTTSTKSPRKTTKISNNYDTRRNSNKTDSKLEALRGPNNSNMRIFDNDDSTTRRFETTTKINQRTTKNDHTTHNTRVVDVNNVPVQNVDVVTKSYARLDSNDKIYNKNYEDSPVYRKDDIDYEYGRDFNRGTKNPDFYSNDDRNFDSDYKNYERNPHDNPLLSRPGVRPAVVDHNRPPITNRPVTRVPSFLDFPKPTESATTHNSGGNEPTLMIGPDDDEMSDAEKQRLEDLAEKMCRKYRSLNTQLLEAIPLLPSPDVLEVNVTKCPPLSVPLVVGGKVVTIREFPHMALLGWIKHAEGGYSWNCGGSLISEQFVLSAGHCSYQDSQTDVISGPPRVVQLGSTNLDDVKATVVPVASVIRHPKYRPGKRYYDIALLKLISKVRFSDVIKPSCLGTPPSTGDIIIATGWGKTEFGGIHSLELRGVSLPVRQFQECQNVFEKPLKLPCGALSELQVCIGDVKGGKDTCLGDSGGPAQIRDKNCQWRIVAITSLGRSCGAPNTPALYSKVLTAFVSAVVFGQSNLTPYTKQENIYANGNCDFYKPHSHTRDSDKNNNYDNNHNGNNNNNNNYDSANNNDSYNSENTGNKRNNVQSNINKSTNYYPNNNNQYSNNDNQFPNNDRYPNNNDRPTSNNNRSPNNNGQYPTNNDRYPKNNDLSPNNNDRSPNNNGRYPNNNDRNPNNNIRIPNNYDQYPSNDDRYPNNNDQSPINNGRYPNNNDRNPNNNIRTPNNFVRYPNNDDRYPNNNDRYPINNGRYPNNNDRNPNNNIRTPNNYDRYPSNDDRYPNNANQYFDSSTRYPNFINNNNGYPNDRTNKNGAIQNINNNPSRNTPNNANNRNVNNNRNNNNDYYNDHNNARGKGNSNYDFDPNDGEYYVFAT